MSVSSSESSDLWEREMAEESAWVWEYLHVDKEDFVRWTGVYDVPKGTRWLSMWKENWCKVDEQIDIFLNVSGISNSSHRHLS